MSFTPSNVVQYNEYYPFGMNTANSWTRENTTGNNFLYNAGTELNSTSNVYDLFYRNYDPVLGRMNQVDPMATSFAGLSPYNFSFNDPVTYNDPLGDCPTCNTAKDFYENAQREMYGEAWRDRMRSLGRVGDDDLYGGMFGRMGAGVNWGAHEEFFQQKGIINTLQQIFKNATFSSGGRNGFWIKTTGINNATAGTKLEDGTPVLAELLIRNIFVSGVSQNHFNTMLNPVVQRMHEGSREFAAHPFGGALLAFVSGGGLFGAGSGALARLGAKQFLMNGTRAAMPMINTGKNVLLNAGRRHISSLTAKSIFTNTGLSIGSQWITKQDISKVDFLDAGIAGLSGRGWGQVVGGVAGGLFDYTIGKGRVGPGSKSGYQLGVDVAIGGLSGSIGAGLNTPLIGLSPSWQTWGGFLNQMVGDGFNSTLNPDYD